jgi:SAM-dependent methyltransferase
MSESARLRCSACGGALAERGPGELSCAREERVFPVAHAVIDLRLDREVAVESPPVPREKLASALADQDRGRPFLEALEEFLRELEEVESDRLMQILGEGRGAWLALLESTGGEALFLGNALSGTVPALAVAGFRVTALDTSPDRARYGQWRNTSRGDSPARAAVVAPARRLPFEDRAFDVVVLERGFPHASPAFGLDLGEVRRVARGEIVLVGNNRFGYKRSTGRRSVHYLPGPFEYAAEALFPRDGERTLAGFRRALAAPEFERACAFALYPHATDFTHVVALDEPSPALTIGPKEKRNVLKVAATRVGLFPVLTPSFCLVSRRSGAIPGRTGARPARIEAILAEIAERIGEPCPEAEHVVATRGQSILVHTRPRDPRAEGPAGRWTVHIPFAKWNIARAPRRNATLASLRARFPWLPTPEPLFFGKATGLLLSCERRLPGWTAPQHSGDRGTTAAILSEVAGHFARLVVRPAAPFTRADFDELVAPKFALVASKVGVKSTAANLARLCDETRERLVGRRMPRVYYHSDLRDKHVQIGEDGSVAGYLDWSTSEEEFLPYQDLLNLVVHGRRQETGAPIREAWRLVRERRRMLAYERTPLERYAAEVGIDDETARAIEAAYPVFVAAMAERTWGFSRPRWLHRQFGL